MDKWWKDPRLDDEGTYDYLVEELPKDNSTWSKYLSTCDDCGKEHKFNRIDTHYFYCWDGWDSMSYTTCWKCHIKSVIKSKISKIKKNILSHNRKLNIKLNINAYLVFRKFCKKNNIQKEYQSYLWNTYYDYWSDKANYKFIRGVR